MAGKRESASGIKGYAVAARITDESYTSSITSEDESQTQDPTIILHRLAEELGRMLARSLHRSDDDDSPPATLLAIALFWLTCVLVVRLCAVSNFAN